MELLNTSPQAIELNPSCSEQAQSNRPGTGYRYENTKPGYVLTVFRVSSVIRPLRSANTNNPDGDCFLSVLVVSKSAFVRYMTD